MGCQLGFGDCRVRPGWRQSWRQHWLGLTMGRTTQSKVCQATIHLLRCQPTLTDAANRQPVPTQRLLISPSETTGAANTRAGKVVRVNVSPNFGNVTHWKKERIGQGKGRWNAFCGMIVCVVEDYRGQVPQTKSKLIAGGCGCERPKDVCFRSTVAGLIF